MSTFAEWADASWDEGRGLLWDAARSGHMVPQSGWYAVELLGRGDTARAERTLTELCALQYDQPGTPWHGTFARWAEAPDPSSTVGVEWVDYDPNWRQFVGTTFAVILRSFSLSSTTESKLLAAIDLAIAGEPPDRVAPHYSNIALMKAWLEADEDCASAVVAAFDEHGAFAEYNSPTYYGIDLYAIALWCRFPPTARFAAWGEHLGSALWRDIARWWHPGLRNLCGPYSRAYGMDMARYVGLLGLWLPSPVVPTLDEPFHHSHDLFLTPMVSLLGGGPADVAFTESEHVVEQTLPGGRVATGWLAPDVILGGERGGPWRAEGQYHPATAHWRRDDGTVGWARIRCAGPIAATARPGVLTVEVAGDGSVDLDTSHPGDTGSSLWTLEVVRS